MTYIIGINAFHGDSSACLVKDGRLLAAAEEERFRRVKHWAGFPSESIRSCLNSAEVSLGDVGHIAVNSDAKANLTKKLQFMVKGNASLKLAMDAVMSRKKRAGMREYLEEEFPEDSFKGEIHKVEHHVAHLASAFLVSPFDTALSVSIDGLGDFASTAWAIGETGKDISVLGRIYFPHSLGIFYEALTHYLGFKNYGDEYKVMGLAPYGQPKYLSEMRKMVLLQDDGTFQLNLDYFSHHLGKGQHQWEGGVPVSGDCYGERMEELLGKTREKDEPLTQHHKDIARSIQAMYEEAFFHLLNTLHKRHRVDNLALAGGCAMNSVANGKVTRNTPFKKVYIQSAAGDAGGAIGAAFEVWNQIDKNTPRFLMDHAYWGPQFSDEVIAEVLAGRGDEIKQQGCTVEKIENEDELCRRTAEAIAAGKVIGWFQGRMEWGPRALGNRSIVCDPRRADMKDILNLKIKRRESFRPFAPSILREAVPDWFEQDDDVPFMMKVFQIREEKRAEIPAVSHVDGSGRLQTVSKDTNTRYYKLIEAFRALTGIPLVLNTSFNENEPVVCRPEEALDCFLRTRMDVLVMENHVIIRSED